MPCRSETEAETIYELSQEVDTLTRLLCTACDKLEDLEKKHKASYLNTPIRKWWENHKEQDRIRRENEAKAEAAAKARRKKQYEKLKKEFEK